MFEAAEGGDLGAVVVDLDFAWGRAQQRGGGDGTLRGSGLNGARVAMIIGGDVGKGPDFFVVIPKSSADGRRDDMVPCQSVAELTVLGLLPTMLLSRSCRDSRLDGFFAGRSMGWDEQVHERTEGAIEVGHRENERNSWSSGADRAGPS